MRHWCHNALYSEHREPGPKHIRTLPTRRRTSRRHYRQHNSPTLIPKNKTDPRSLSHSTGTSRSPFCTFFCPSGSPFLSPTSASLFTCVSLLENGGTDRAFLRDGSPRNFRAADLIYRGMESGAATVAVQKGAGGGRAVRERGCTCDAALCTLRGSLIADTRRFLETCERTARRPKGALESKRRCMGGRHLRWLAGWCYWLVYE